MLLLDIKIFYYLILIILYISFINFSLLLITSFLNNHLCYINFQIDLFTRKIIINYHIKYFLLIFDIFESINLFYH